MTNDEIFIAFVISMTVLCLTLAIVLFAFKMYLYKKMKQDGEEIKIISKGFAIGGIITFIFYSSLLIAYIHMLLNNHSDNNFAVVATAYLPFWFLSSFCLIGNKSAVIGMKRYFYSDIAQIENKFSTYIITMTDGKIKKPGVMFGREKLNEELRKKLPRLTINSTKLTGG